MSSLKEVCNGIPDPLPPPRQRDETLPHAPVRTPDITPAEQRVSIEYEHFYSIRGGFCKTTWFDNIIKTRLEHCNCEPQNTNIK